MNAEKLRDASVHCPMCGHAVHVMLDPSQGDQDYQDECRACGHDIHLHLEVDEQHDQLRLRVEE